MTYKELQDDVAALGFEGYIANSEAMLSAARRALRTIFTEKEARGVFELYQTPRLPKRMIENFIHTGECAEELCFEEKAVSFKTSGTGSYIINDGRGERRTDFNRNSTHHREHLFGNARVTFIGDYCYTVFDIAVYDRLYGPEKSDIPHPSLYTEYNLRNLIPDFLSPTLAPEDDYGLEIPGASIISDVMKIPSAYSGKVRIQYKRCPRELAGLEEEVLDLPLGCEHLLPLLTAAYFWLDDDEEKASYYMSLYRDGMLSHKRYVRSGADSTYANVNRWA